jgi:hypothetical protein
VKSAAASSAPRALALASVPAGSDYANAVTYKFVSEQSLSQFEILNTVFDAMAQTHYDDPANLNQGPYASIVSWTEKKSEQDQKRLLRWVVDSTRADASSPNVVKAWFGMTFGDGNVPGTIQAYVVIDRAPTQNPDGSYADYGKWRMDVKVYEPGIPFQFVATSDVDGQGRPIVMISQREPAGAPGVFHETKGILLKSAQAGSGKVTFPDYQSCQSGPPCPQVSVAYRYDGNVVTLQKAGQAAVTKDRNTFVDVVNRYGLYDATTGADVSKAMRFGFPVRATVPGMGEVYGYYGAWQGRHQLWANGMDVPAGFAVTKGDVPPGQSAPTYTTSAPFPGILVRRTYAPASLSDLTGLIVETWDNESYQLGFDGTRWCKYPAMSFGQSGPVASCDGKADFDLSLLVNDPTDPKHNVMINVPTYGPMQPGQQPPMVVYEPQGPQGPGFYDAVASPGSPHPQRSSDALHPFVAGNSLYVNSGGSIWITWDGQAWVRKSLLSFDASTYTPTFKDASFDVPYELQVGREYYFNNSGTNYVVRAQAAPLGTSVQLEIQTVAHPWDAGEIVPAGTTFSPQWCGAGAGMCSTYRFVTDPADPAFMKLVYATVAQSDGQKSVGDAVTTGMWGLQGSDGGTFNWDYPFDGMMGASQQFLKDSGGQWVRLHDPLPLGSVALSNASGTRTFGLQFDGNWMQGLPNVWDELRKAGFEVTDVIRAKVFAVPNGTVVGAGAYLTKQLQVSEYMATLPGATPLDLSEASAISLSTVPTFVDRGMGAMPDPVPLRYSEGKPVTSP